MLLPVAALPLAAAGGAAFSLGIQAAVSKDLSDRIRREETAVLGAGPAVVITGRAGLAEAALARRSKGRWSAMPSRRAACCVTLSRVAAESACHLP